MHMWNLTLSSLLWESQIFWHQMGVLQLSAILTLYAWRSPQSHPWKGSVPQGCLHCRCQSWDQGRLYHWLTRDESHAPTISSSHLIVCQNSTQNSGKPLIDIYWLVTRVQLWKSQMEKVHRAREGGVVWHRVSRPSVSAPPSWHFDVLTDLKALCLIVQEFL